MKKFLLFSLSILAILVLTACGTDSASTDDEKKEKDQPAEEKAAKEEQETNKSDKSAADPKKDETSHEPVEPEEDTVCVICNMKVYDKNHEMGVFTGQGITKSGETVFFDDVGCVMNYDDAKGDTLKTQWVRDYETLEWIETSEAVPVKTDLKSPMKWGYIFFDSKDRAEKFIEENGELNPALAHWEEIDRMAAERYKKKMEAMKNQQDAGHIQKEEDGHTHDHGHDTNHMHESENNSH